MDDPLNLPEMPDMEAFQKRIEAAMGRNDLAAVAAEFRSLGNMFHDFADAMEAMGRIFNGPSQNREQRRAAARHLNHRPGSHS